MSIIAGAFRAIRSNHGDMFWLMLGCIALAIVAAIVTGAVFGADPFFQELAEEQRIDRLTAIPVLTLNALLLWICIHQRPLAFGFDGTGRSVLLALLFGAILIAAKWWLRETIPARATPPGWLIVLATCIVAPIVEEFFFRGYMWNLYRSRGFSDGVTCLAVTLLFVIPHAPETVLLALHFVFVGGCLGLIRYYSGSPLLGIVFHAAMNVIVTYGGY